MLSRNSRRSAPALKLSPAPVSMTAPTSESTSHLRSAPASSITMAVLSGLRLRGLLSVTVATRPEIVTSMSAIRAPLYTSRAGLLWHNAAPRSGEGEMPSYIILGQYTDQGIRNIKQSPNRTQAVEQALQQAGGKMLSYYQTMGGYDFVCAVELPDDETAMRILMQVGAQGNVRTTTLKAFPREEIARVIDGV